MKRINDIQTNYKFNNGQEMKAKHSRNKQQQQPKSGVLDDQANEAGDLPALVKSEQTAAAQPTNLQLSKLLNNVRLNETSATTASPTSFLNTSLTSSQLSSFSSLIALMNSNEIYRFQCLCKAFGAHRTVESRKAAIQLSCELRFCLLSLLDL